MTPKKYAFIVEKQIKEIISHKLKQLGGTVDGKFGNTLAHLIFTFGAMNPHDPIIIAPPITEVPDYILYRQYEEPRFLPGKPVRKPKDMSEWFFHPTAEAAL